MVFQQNKTFHQEHGRQEHFGTLLKMLRLQWRVTQEEVIIHLPGWSQTMYTRLEGGKVAPAFDQLHALYSALRLAGIEFTLSDRRRFIALARQRIEGKKTHLEHRSDVDWAELWYQLARVDLLPVDAVEPSDTSPLPAPTQPLPADIRHLVGREEWHTSIVSYLQGSLPKKLVVIQGPMGIGKSSELNRLAKQLMREEPSNHQVILCELPPVERGTGPGVALEVFLATVLTDIDAASAQPTTLSLDQRMAVVLQHLEKAERPLAVLIDNGEGMLDDEGSLAACWEHFLAKFLRSRHQATIFLATREWPGWYGREQSFVVQTAVPALLPDKGVMLLQQLGLECVPVKWLQEASEKVGGVPLGLEWLATLVKNPLDLDDWEAFDFGTTLGESSPGGNGREDAEIIQALLRLLAEPHIFGGTLATKLHPLLEKIIGKRLSSEARGILEVLAVSYVPLAKPALKVLCERPSPIRELRCASLLVAYPDRVQLLPMVAAAVIRRLSAQQMHEAEQQLIEAYASWLQEDIRYEREGGMVVAELAVLLLQHHRLLEAAELLIRYGWLSFNLGHASRLARLAEDVLQRFDWHENEERECGGLLLHYFLSPFLGKVIDARRRLVDYQRILEAIVARKIVLRPPTEVYVTHHLMVSYMNELRFQEARALLDACCERLAPHLPSNVDLQASLLEKRALLLGRWSEWAQEEQGDTQAAQGLLDQTIALYRQCTALLSAAEEEMPSLKSSPLKKRLARTLNSLGYHLNKRGQFEEALQVTERGIELKEQGYLEFGGLAASYGEKAQILAGLGRFREALLFDERALQEVQRLAQAGHTSSQEEVWIYLVDRGRLYLQLGRIDEAEQLLRESIPHIHARRRIYQMRAKKALEEIEQWRLASTSPHYQLDWRWVGRFRELASFNAFGWLAPAGPFTQEEQAEWDRLFPQRTGESVQKRLEALLAETRQRELAKAIAERREPRLWYPAIPIDEVRARVASLLQLDGEVSHSEPNAIVRRLYHEAIEEQVQFLCLIEATYQGDSQRFWEINRWLHPEPTHEEMDYTLSRVRRLLLQGFMCPETGDVSQRLVSLLREHLYLSLNLSLDGEEAQELQQDSPLSPSRTGRTVAPEVARRFFEAVLRESGYEGWQVIIDPNASSARVESGLRHFFLPANPLSVDQVRGFLAHELGDHIAISVAGERSLLGLLGIGTKGYQATREGLALYEERQTAALQGRTFDESRIWLGTLATGLARGVMVPPQTFASLYAFFESFFLLYRLLKRPDEGKEASQERARQLALSRCLRTYRGVPDLGQAGVCYTKDALYLRGVRMIENALGHDVGMLDRLAVGKVALEQLPDLQELGIVAPFQSLKRLASEQDLESYIFSFERPEDHSIQQG